MMSKLRIILAFISVFSAQQMLAQTYCTPNINPAGCWTGADVNSVTFGTFSDLNTGCGGAGYTNRTSLSGLNLTVGASQSFTITSTSGTTGMFYAIWIDLNSDGDFADTDEFVWNGLASGVSTGSFTVPNGSGTRRLRILAKQSTSPLTQSASCQGSFWGELQDYNCLINAAGCPVAYALTAHTLKATTATLAWAGTGTKYRIEYGQVGFTPGAGTLDSSTTNSKTITGLAAITSYSYYVKNVCSAANQSGWNGPYTFTTRCAEISTFPFTENFDATPWIGSTGNNYGADAISACWARNPSYLNFNYAWVARTAASTNSLTGPSADASGSGNYMQVSSIGAPFGTPIFAHLDLPVFNLSSLTAPILKYKYHMYGAGTGTIYLEGSTNGGQTWSILDSITGQQQIGKTAGYLEKSINLSTVKSALTYLRVRAKSNGSNGDMAIDNIFVGEAPSCPAPSSPAMTSILGNGATVSWNSTNTVFQVEYGLQGFAQGTGLQTTVTNANSHTLTNLLSETFYDIYLRSDCSNSSNGTSTWLGPITFRTHTLPPFVETFTTAFLPDSRWAKREAIIGNPTVFNTTNNSQWVQDGYLNNGTTGAARLACYTTSIRNDWFFTKSIDLGIGNTWELYFDIGLTADGNTSPSVLGADDKLLIIISTDNGATWNATNTIMTINQASGLTNTGTILTKSLIGYSGVVKFGFYFQSTTSSPNSTNLFVDNIGVRNPGSCPAPNAVNTTNVAPTSLWLNWTSSAVINSYDVEYGPTGFTQGTGTFINSILVDSTIVTGLLPATSYDFYVRSNCGAGTYSAWVGPFSSLSGCPAIFSTPYATNFEANDVGFAVFGGKMNNCWVANPISTSFHWKTGIGGQVSTSGLSGPNTDHTLQTVGVGKYAFADAAAGPDALLTGGPFDLTGLTEPHLEFYYHMFGAGMGTMHVDISNDEQTTWQRDVVIIRGQQQISSTAIWKLAGSPLSQFVNDTIYIRFRAEYGTSYLGDMAIDDLTIDEADVCESPNALNLISTTNTTATLSWGTYEPATTVEYGPKGFIQATGFGTVVHNASPNVTFTGLTPNKYYDFYVKDTCNPTKWVGPLTFKTDCPGPLAGVYTIGGTVGASNFATLDSAVTRLNQCGVSAAVTFNLSGGKHFGFYKLGVIAGASATNTIQFIGTLGLDSVIAPTIEYALQFAGTSYVNFSGITFVNANGPTVVWFNRNAHHITLSNCEFIGLTSVGSNTSALVAGSYIVNGMSSYGNNAHHITLNQNRFVGSYYGVNFNGPESGASNTFSFSNNVFESQAVPFRFAYLDSVTVHHNKTISNLGNFGGIGVFAFKSANVNITSNYFNINGSGISIQSPTGMSNLTNNELISTSYGIQLNQGSNVNVYHNSINSLQYGMYSIGATVNINVRNNIFVSDINSAFYSAVSPATSIINHNVYKTNTGNVATIGGINFATLAAWKSAFTGYNANSLQGDPVFLSALDLQTVGTLANNVGDNSVGILVDIDGISRPIAGSTIVDIGAFEFTPKQNDAELVSIYRPLLGCGDSTTLVQVIVKNWGINNITSLPISVVATGGVTSTINFTYTGNLANRQSDTVTVGTLNTFAGGASVILTATTQLVNDEDATNNSKVKTLKFIPGNPQFLAPDSVCASTLSAIMHAVPLGNVTYSWYPTLTSTTAADTGSTFNYNPSAQTSWYLGYGFDGTDEILTPLTTIQGGNGGIMFRLEAKRNISVDSLILNDLYIIGSQTPVSIYYIANGPIAGNETNSSNWTLHESQIITSGGVSQVTKMTLNTPLVIPAGATYSIYIYAPLAWQSVTSTATQVYNSKFMKITPGKGLIGHFSYPILNKQYSGSIFASEYACNTTRVLVSAPINNNGAVASFTTVVSQPNKVDVDASASNGQNVTWLFGDGTTGTGKLATHFYTVGGAYTITCLVEDTVCNAFDTATFNVQMTIGVSENDWSSSLNIFPNPSTGEFTIAFDLRKAQDVTISVVDALGREIRNDKISRAEGATQYKLDLSNQARGLFFVKITAGENTVVKKITKL